MRYLPLEHIFAIVIGACFTLYWIATHVEMNSTATHLLVNATTTAANEPNENGTNEIRSAFNRWALNGTLLDCGRILRGDKEYIAEVVASDRIKFTDPEHLDMDCDGGIRWRNRFPKEENWPNDHPLAQVRVVYTDYVFLEMELAATYSPNNWYCYAIDAKANVSVEDS